MKMIHMIGLTLLAMILVILAFSALPARAHDFWINHSGYKGPDGTHCCGQNDCKMVLEADVKIGSGGYVLRTFNNEFVPFSEAQQSEDGDFWRCRKSDGSRRCFFAPQQGS